MNSIKNLFSHIPDIEARIHYSFRDKQKIILAMTHRSFVNENKEVTNEHNERLEFLGDSVLGLLVAEYLYHHLPPNTPEGELSFIRSRLVEATSCVIYIQKLDLGKFVLLGRGERMNDGRGRETILADLFEAIIGAIYLDGGLEAARNFVFDLFSHEISSIIETPFKNWKAVLQDYCQKNFQTAPIYQVLDETGPDHSKIFTIGVFLQEKEILGQGRGSSKKEAQQAAAEDALSRINLGF